MLKTRNIIPVIRRAKPSNEAGMTMIELMIAMFILAIGMLGSMVMIQLGMQSNSRNKNDTSAVVLNQEILEKFAAIQNFPKGGPISITDCSSGTNSHLASLTEAVAPGNGATLYTAATAPTPGQIGDVDWTQPAPTLATSAVAGYAMDYQTCGGDVFEVRWNVTLLPPNGGTSSYISLLTVSTKQVAAKNSAQAMLYSVPVTLHTLIENGQ